MAGGIQILPTDRGPGAAIGAGLGEGLGDQLPKEMDRGRLASALRGMQGQGAADPLEMTSRLIAGGADQSLVQQLVPMIQQQAASQQFAGGGLTGGSGGIPTTMGAGEGDQGYARGTSAIAAAPQDTKHPLDKEGIDAADIYETPKGVAQQEQSSGPPQSERQDNIYYNRPLPQEELARQAQTLFANNRAFFKNDPNKALEYVQQADERRVKADETREQRMKTIREGLQESMKQRVGENTADAIIGDTIEKIINKAQTEAIDEGEMSDKKAIDKYSKDALDFAKTRSRVLTRGWGSFLSAKQGREAMRNLDLARREYGKFGLEDELRDDLMHTWGLSRPYASYLTFPPSKEVKKAFDGIKPLKSTGGVSLAQDVREAAQKMGGAMTDSDNPQTLALMMRNKGYPPNIFMSRLQELVKENEINPNESQRRDLERTDFSPGISDLLYTSFGILPDEPVDPKTRALLRGTGAETLLRTIGVDY